ncbi:MAG: ATP-binding protein [Pasteurella oralis]|uniref:AAA family ATPase n=1 Tax=Pasteurella oralis TaxID=1071947 RepID=UPI0027096EA0|nr:ATP-binding protein [Pasteurella oralis]
MCEYQLNPSQVSLYTERLILKILFEHQGFNHFLSAHHWQDDSVANALGLPSELDGKENYKAIVKELLKNRMAELSFSDEIPDNVQQMYQNLEKITELLALNLAEQKIFQLAIHIRSERVLERAFSFFPKIDINRAIAIVSSLLDLELSTVRKALNKNGKLFLYGLLERYHSPDSVDEFLGWGDVLDFQDFVSQPISEQSLLENTTVLTDEPTLTLAKFDYIAENREMMLAYLKIAVATQKKGVNILLHGLPGTGKTELAALLGKELGLQTYTMAYMDSDGDALSGKSRLNNCRLAQKLLDGRKALIIFDEIEDIFGSGLFERSIAQQNKAWMNQFLETNAIPMIWISNHIGNMDSAYLRRFDLIFEMPNLPAENKAKLIKELVGEQLSTEYIHHFSQIDALSPAVLTRGLNVAATLNAESSPQQFAEQTIKIFNQTLVAQGYKKITPLVESKVAYNLDWVSCNDNIHKISDGLRCTKSGRICCYGPPGTGKTAWANWLAKELGMPVLLRQGSDLLDKYVGGTERNIARAFEQAKANNMVLVFDEVDTFLFARESGQRSWEHSQVNEMLTQIENFDGLLVVSTNLMDELDPAALRRFDLKLHFGYLNREQRHNLAQEQGGRLGLTFANGDLQRLDSLDNLTPGDFAAVARRHRFSPFETSEEWLEALADECRLKKGKTTRRIGF